MGLSISSVVRSRTFVWMIAAIAILTLFYLCPYHSETVEYLYSRGFFRIYRTLWDYTFALSPLPLIYLVIIGALLFLFGCFSKARSKGRISRFFSRCIQLISFAAIVFYVLWGFNYKRQSISYLLELGDEPPHEDWLRVEYCKVMDSMIALRQLLDNEVADIYVSEKSLREDLENRLSEIGLPVYGRVRARKIWPKGSLLHLSTAGVYLPWAGEGHIDGGLHPLVHPFTMMHEMTHGYGWTGEDECNFIALISAISSEDPYVRYSGYFGYWRYLRFQLYRLDREVFDQLFRPVDEEIMSDYEEVLSYSRRYKEILPEIRDIFYDTYLKSHGVSSGLISYNEMIRLAYRWELRYGSLLSNPIPEAQPK